MTPIERREKYLLQKQKEKERATSGNKYAGLSFDERWAIVRELYRLENGDRYDDEDGENDHNDDEI